MNAQAAQKTNTAPSKRPANLTPMMEQYWDVKEEHPDCLIFYRMGDFYELFFNDAITAAAALDITLTKRGKAGANDDNIPMCGVPFHSYENYMARLIKQGYKVAICEQIETPEQAKKRGGSKALVKRDVIRIVTPGTITEDTLLNARSHNYLAAIVCQKGEWAMAWADLSTGDLSTQLLSDSMVASALTRLSPSEVIMQEKVQQNKMLHNNAHLKDEVITYLPDTRFDAKNALKRMKDIYRVETLDGFGDFTEQEVSAAGTLIDYIALTQKGDMPFLKAPHRITSQDVMDIDSATRRSLELTVTQNGDRNGSLLHTIDRCITGSGARLLAGYLSGPLTCPNAIQQRLDMVQFFLEDTEKRHGLRNTLQGCPDMERALSRLALSRGGPRDLAAIRDGLIIAKTIQKIIAPSDEKNLSTLPAGIDQCQSDLDKNITHKGLIDELSCALKQDLPLLARDGGFIAHGYSATLDEFLNLRSNGRQIIAELQAEYIEATGINSLKIKHNNVLGYFVDVTGKHADTALNMKNDDGSNFFVHRQTLANSTRFTTPKLAELDKKIAEAEIRAMACEMDLFTQLVDKVLQYRDSIASASHALAQLDVAAGLAELAAHENWCRPVIDDSLTFDIKGGRHPVVEAALTRAAQSQRFIPNDCCLSSDERLWLLTGPNMAGKSTFLRQNALIALLAQCGSYVPATSAHIGVVDKLFSRVGASDDLARGHSTFMVEMVETATILNKATERSLVILDEIGRGTATFDGLSIAWASVEHLHDINKARGLFATHYHELTTLTQRLDALATYTMRIKEWENEIIFLHEVVKGSADRSYGIHVARLAGLPQSVVKRAEDVLAGLEKENKGARLKAMAEELPLFSTLKEEEKASAPPKWAQELQEKLASLDPDTLSPRDALEILYELKRKSNE